MAEPIEIIIAAIGGGGGTVALQFVTGWWKQRSDNHKADRDADAKLDEQRNELMFDLLRNAREEISALRSEAAVLRQMTGRAAHLEEALDHIHALLHAEGDAEKRAAFRRARAFLAKLRPDAGDPHAAAQPTDAVQRPRQWFGIEPPPL